MDLLVRRCLEKAAAVPNQSRRIRKFCDAAASGDLVAGDPNRSMNFLSNPTYRSYVPLSLTGTLKNMEERRSGSEDGVTVWMVATL